MKSTLRARVAALAIGSGLAAGALLGAGSANAAAPWAEAKLAEFFCEGTHSPAYYADWEKSEAMLPYELKKATTPAAEARKELYGTRALNAATAKSMCDDQAGFTEVLKRHTLDLKGDLKPEYATAEGMKKFYEEKAAYLTEVSEREQALAEKQG